jgi:hypothetical protein
MSTRWLPLPWYFDIWRSWNIFPHWLAACRVPIKQLVVNLSIRRRQDDRTLWHKSLVFGR